MFPAIIIAGGKASRIKQITRRTPKSLIKINNKAFIDYQIDYLKKNGVKKIIFCLGHLGEKIKKYLDKKQSSDLKFLYSFDGTNPIGTGGAVKKALIDNERYYFVIYGDSYLRVNLKNVIKKFYKCNKPALMTVIKNNNKWDKSNVELKNNNIINYNKFEYNSRMQYIDYGLSIIDKKKFIKYKKNKFDLAEILAIYAKKQMIASYKVSKRFYEIGSIKGINEFKKYIMCEDR